MLRGYQQKTVDYILNNLNSKILIEAPTGAGKTVIASELVRLLIEKKLKVFFVVANEPLIMQTYRKFKSMNPSVIKAGYDEFYNPDADVQIVMIQTLYRRNYNLSPDVIIIDEVDFGSEGIMRKMLDDVPTIGLTATPCTAKGSKLKGFEKFFKVATVKELQDEGYLSKCFDYQVKTPPKLKGVKISSTGDYVTKSLSNRLSNEFETDSIAKLYKEKCDKGYKGIVFAVDINHAETLKRSFLKYGFLVDTIHTGKKNNEEILEKHQNGAIQLLINVGKLTRGYDDTQIIDCLDCRPTKSLRLYLQMIGRCARPDGQYNFFRHYDFAGNLNEFGSWQDDREYPDEVNLEEEKDKKKKEIKEKYVVCPYCFMFVVPDANGNCPECGEEIRAKREEVIRTNIAGQVIEWGKEQTLKELVIQLLTMEGRNKIQANWFINEFMKICDDTELIKKKVKECIRKHHKIGSVFYKLKKEKENDTKHELAGFLSRL